MRSGSTPDESLMGLAALGRRDALDVLVRRHASPLLTFITRMVGDRHRGEELFQEVFLAVWIKRRQFDPNRRFKPWLYRIAVNQCRSAFRRRALPMAPSYADDPPVLVAAADPSPGDAAVATETRSLVDDAVAALPPTQRTVLVLRTWLELSYTEIAAILGRGETTVRSNMHHALERLRAYLESRTH